MSLPLSYNLRNLTVRKTTTVMTALGIALSVAVLLAVLALVEGLRQAFATTGHPLQIIVLRKGSQSELNSNFTRQQFNDLKLRPGIARTATGEPMASLEIVTVINLPSVDNPDGMNVTVRGISPVGLQMRESLKLEQGRWFRRGMREVVVGRSIAQRYPAARLGETLEFGRSQWKVVGIMSAGDSALNSEIWTDADELSADYNRSEVLSSTLIRATDAITAQALINELKADQRLNVDAVPEREYYAQQTRSAAPIQFLGIFVASIMAVGSCFAAMNTMYAAVARRAREIGTLRVLGFSRASILFSFFLESLFLSLLGGLLGCLLTLPLNGFTTAIGSFTTFSEITFDLRVTPAIMVTGVLFALLMGTFGGLFPARMAARKEILTALRET